MTPNADLLIYLFNAIAVFNTVVILVVFFNNYRNYAPAFRFLLIFLMGMFFVNLITFLFKTTYILYVPWLFRLPSPLYYMMFPAAYLYVKHTIADHEDIKQREWLHFAPGVLHFFEYLPFYLKDKAYKTQHILESLRDPLGTYAHNEGVMPAYVHNVLRGLQGLIYGLLILQLVYAGRGLHLQERYYPGVIRWLRTLGWIVLIFSLSILSTFVGGWASGAFRSINLAFWSALALSSATVTMFLHPLTLYGMPRLNKPVGHWPVPAPLPVVPPEEKPVATDLLSQAEAVVDTMGGQAQEPEWVGHCRERIEQFRTQSLSFKECGYTIREMAVELDIPQHHLSYVLNRVYDIRFNDFINEMRICYLEERLVDPERLREMTLEGLSKEAGFTSRSTFIRAFHRLRGKNPSTYFKEKLA